MGQAFSPLTSTEYCANILSSSVPYHDGLEVSVLYAKVNEGFI
jgi:hypothetical protein